MKWHATKLVTARLPGVSLTDTSSKHLPVRARGFVPYAPRLVRTQQGAIRQTVSKQRRLSFFCPQAAFQAQNSPNLWNFTGTFHFSNRAKWKSKWKLKWKLKWKFNWKLSIVALLYSKSPFSRIGFFRCLRNCCDWYCREYDVIKQ